MKRRNFLGSLLGGGALAAIPVVALAEPSLSNPLKESKNVFVRVRCPVKTGDRLICSAVENDYPNAWLAKENETPHCIAKMDVTFTFADPVIDDNGEVVWVESETGLPYSQVLVVDRI